MKKFLASKIDFEYLHCYFFMLSLTLIVIDGIIVNKSIVLISSLFSAHLLTKVLIYFSKN